MGIAKFYIDLIKKGLRAIEDIPQKYREDVQALLESEE